MLHTFQLFLRVRATVFEVTRLRLGEGNDSPKVTQLEVAGTRLEPWLGCCHRPDCTPPFPREPLPCPHHCFLLLSCRVSVSSWRSCMTRTGKRTARGPRKTQQRIRTSGLWGPTLSPPATCCTSVLSLSCINKASAFGVDGLSFAHSSIYSFVVKPALNRALADLWIRPCPDGKAPAVTPRPRAGMGCGQGCGSPAQEGSFWSGEVWGGFQEGVSEPAPKHLLFRLQVKDLRRHISGIEAGDPEQFEWVRGSEDSGVRCQA